MGAPTGVCVCACVCGRQNKLVNFVVSLLLTFFSCFTAAESVGCMCLYIFAPFYYVCDHRK